MKVQLISYTPDPELLMTSAARLCYKDISAIDIRKYLEPGDVESLLTTVIESGHHSVLEHVTFSFALDEVSRVLTHQLVRHRVGIAYSQQSQRYTKLDATGFIIPETIAKSNLSMVVLVVLKNGLELYEALLFEGVPKEDARYVLPQAIETRLVMTVNARQLIHMYAINACFRSQWEFRDLMNALRREVKTVSPRLAKEMQIKCIAMGYCNEASPCKELGDKMPRKNDVSSFSDG